MALKILNPATSGDADFRKPAGASVKKYTVPAANATVVSSIIICNTGVVADNFYIYVMEKTYGIQGVKTAVYQGSLPAGESFQIVAGISLGEGDGIAYKSDSGNLTFTISGDESA